MGTARSRYRTPGAARGGGARVRAWHRSRLRARTLWSTHRLIIVDPAPDAQRGEVAHPPRQRTQLLDRHVGGERRVVQAHHDKRQERPHPTDRVPRDRGQSVVTHLDRPPERVPHDDAKVARVHRQALRPHFHKPHHEAGHNACHEQRNPNFPGHRGGGVPGAPGGREGEGASGA